MNTTRKLIIEWNDIEREKRKFIENRAAPRKLASDKTHTKENGEKEEAYISIQARAAFEATI